MRSAKEGALETRKPCARWLDTDPRSASGDPAMVFTLRMASILPIVRARCPSRPAAGLLLGRTVQTGQDRSKKRCRRFQIMPEHTILAWSEPQPAAPAG